MSNVRADLVSADQSNLVSGWLKHQRKFLFFLAGLILFFVAVVSGVALGGTTVPFEHVVRILAAHLLPSGWVDLTGIPEPERIVVWLIRVPRVLVAASIGAALAVAGVQMQSLFNNPLASPDVVGTSAGGAFGAVLAISTGLAAHSLFYLPLFSFIGSLAALFLVYALATRRGKTPIATLLLGGIALNALIGAGTSFIVSMNWVRWEVAQEILFWLMGGLDSRTWDHVRLAVPCIAVGLALSLVYGRELDLLLLGEEAATTLGIDTEQTKRIILAGAALLTGASVAVGGTIGFVGLIVPHVVRLLIGPRHRWLVPGCALSGAVFLIFADILARTIHPPEEIRLGIVTAVFGAPFFLFLLLRHNRKIGY